MTFIETSLIGDSERICGESVTLRDVVRDATATDHAALDQALAGLDLTCRDDLVRFLGIHLSARAGIERWLADACPAVWLPPAQTGLIAQDLIALGGLPAAFPAPDFVAGEGNGWIGPAYVVAGSHLGNRLLLAQAEPALPRDAQRFLTAAAMQGYWRRLRVLLDETPGPDGARGIVAGAKATFAHFAACVGQFRVAA